MNEYRTQDFFQDFLDESSDHLGRIGLNLVALEQSSGQVGEDAAGKKTALLQELFRSFHTLKGLAGMAGLRQAELLSHALESVLRLVQRGEIEAGEAVIDDLVEGTRSLETVIATVRDPSQPMPDVEPQLGRLAAILPAPIGPEPPAGSTPSGAALAPPAELASALAPWPELIAGMDAHEWLRLRQAQVAGWMLAVAEFTPSGEKAAAGININRVREDLGRHGELIKAVPLSGGPVIRFVLLLALPPDFDRSQYGLVEWTPLQVDNPSVDTREQAHPLPPPPQTVVRVELERLDELMRLVSDLVVDRARLNEAISSLSNHQGISLPVLDRLEQTAGRMDRRLRELRKAVVHIRMVPLIEVFGRMPLVVRDLARAAGKQVRLEVSGEDTEADKLLVERLLDPLLHLVRNAIIHGIESPEERRGAGKPERGTLRLSAETQGDRIRVVVADDGRGIQTGQVIDRAVELGLLPKNRAETSLTPGELLDLISRPGLSTQQQIDLAAGRGVGMDVVQREVARLAGSLHLETTLGRGSSFILFLPYSLTIVDALLIHSGGQRFAVPQSAIEQVVEIDPMQVEGLEEGESLTYRGNILRLVRLNRLFGLDPQPGLPFCYGLVPAAADRQAALVVDKVVGLQVIVVRPVSDPLLSAPGISGVTELEDGDLAMILDLPALFHDASRQFTAAVSVTSGDAPDG